MGGSGLAADAYMVGSTEIDWIKCDSPGPVGWYQGSSMRVPGSAYQALPDTTILRWGTLMFHTEHMNTLGRLKGWVPPRGTSPNC